MIRSWAPSLAEAGKGVPGSYFYISMPPPCYGSNIYMQDLSHSAGSAGGRIQPKAYTLDPMKRPNTLSRQCGEPSHTWAHMQLIRNARPQSSQITEPLWTDPWVKRNGICVYELISTFKKKKKVSVGNDLLNFPSESLHVRKKPPPPPPVRVHDNQACIQASEMRLTACFLKIKSKHVNG